VWIDDGRLARPSSFPASAACRGGIANGRPFAEAMRFAGSAGGWTMVVSGVLIGVAGADGSGRCRRRGEVPKSAVRCPRRRQIVPAPTGSRRIRSRPVHLPGAPSSGVRGADRCVETMAFRIPRAMHAANGKALVSSAFQHAMKNSSKYRLDVWMSKRELPRCRNDGVACAGGIRPLAKRIDLPTKIH